MPRHTPHKTTQRDEHRAHAFKVARSRALELAETCEETFDAALAATSDMLGLVAGPEDAASHVDARTELRRLVRRLQRRLDSA